MGNVDRTLLNRALREDLAAFTQRAFQTVSPGEAYLHNWHVELIADRLRRCLGGEIKRLIITVPPRYLKSICASVAFPAWALGHDPSLRIICASYANELAAKHARDCRAVMESAWYRQTFPKTRLDASKNTELEFTTSKKGFRLATSVGGMLTGRGGQIIIVDDPLKANDAMSEAKRNEVNEWFGSTLFTRLDNKAEGRIIVVTQRLHVDDLVGHLLELGSDWVHLCLPAIAESDERFELDDGQIVTRRAGEALHPERESLEVLEQIRRSLGSHAFSAQYLQNPIPAEGELIKWAWFRFYDVPLKREPNDIIIQSWDTASKADEIHDFSVCTTWLRRGDDHHLLDVQRCRLDYPGLRRFVVELAQHHKPDAVLVEDKGSGIQLIQDLNEEGIVRPIAITPEGDKITRMYGQTAKIEAGRVILPKTAPWLDDFRKEVLQFPKGRHDDQVDSLAQYLGWTALAQEDLSEAMFFHSEFGHQWDAMFGTGSY